VRGAFFDNFNGAVTVNLIRPDGKINGLNLPASDTLVVRDDDGGVSPYTGLPFDAIPITVTHSFNTDQGATLKFVLEADAWDSLISFDPGIPVELGGILELTFAADVNLTSQIGRAFQLFDWSNVSPTGAVDVVSPYTWDLSKLYTTGEVTFAAASGVPGDFNHDGAVNGADFVVWRKGLGTTYTASAYNVWRANFGATADNGAAIDPVSIPEPATSLVLIAITSALAMTLRRRPTQ
jgi:hypothetical protein